MAKVMSFSKDGKLITNAADSSYSTTQYDVSYLKETVITNGLIRYIDFSDPACVPASSSVKQLSSFNQTATTYGSPTYSSSTDSLACYGNQMLVMDDVTATNYVTIEMVFEKDTDGGDEDILFNKENTWELKTNAGNISWAVYANNQSWFWYDTGYDITNNVKYLIDLTYDGTYIKTYINGTLQNTYTYTSGGVLANQSSAYPKFNSRGSTKSDFVSVGYHTLYTWSIYDKALTASEIKSNYNYLRTKHSI